MKVHSIPFEMMYGFMVIRVSEMVSTAFRLKSTSKKKSPVAIFITGPENFWGVGIFSEGHFDHFYGSDGHETTHHLKDTVIE
jgi:hypothetical protein